MESNGVVEVVVGTYEQFLLGYKLIQIDESSYSLTQSFANHAHIGAIKCVASSDKFLVSGSTDETIQLFNMRTRQEVGSLVHHNGTVTGLEFYADSHLLSSSDDGTICVWSVKNWQCLKTLHGHKNGVNDLSVHPSGKMVLSVSKDKTLCTWNLIKGRSAYVTNIKTVADFVLWSPSGTHFLVGFGNRVDVYNLETAGVIHKIKSQKRVNSATFITEDICAIGGDGEDIELHDIRRKLLINTFKTHSNRIKALECIPASTSDVKWLFSASSDGFIKLRQLYLNELTSEPQIIAEVNSSCRPTCLAVFVNKSFAKAEVCDNEKQDRKIGLEFAGGAK